MRKKLNFIGGFPLVKNRSKHNSHHPKGLRGDINRIATTRLLTRVIAFLSSPKSYKDMKNNIPDRGLDDAINFLKNHKLIKKILTKNWTYKYITC